MLRFWKETTTWRKLLFLISTMGAFTALLSFAGGAAAMTNTGGAAPWVASDKADYAPGSTVHLTGGNWQPGEAVQIVTNDSIGNSWIKTDNVTADDTGAITDDVVLPNYFISDYSVTATGAQSGTATTSFTDAASLTLSPTSGPAATSVTATTGGGEFSSSATDIGIYWDGTINTTNGTLVATCSTNGGGNITAGCSFTVPAGAGTGSHRVVATEKSKTSNSIDAAFTVSAPACTAASVTTQPSSQSITYGANATFTAASGGSPAPTVQWQVSTDGGTSFGDISGATSTTLTLTKPAVAASGNKYHAVFTNTCNGTKTATTNDATLTVARKAVTVTPDAGQSKAYGASDPTLTYTSNPALESGDSFTGGLARAAGEGVGSYPINLGTLSAGNNYNLALSATTVNFSITPKPVTVTADDKSKAYGSADPTFTFQVSGLQSGDSLTGVSCGVAGPHTNAGSYDITCSGNTNANYSPTYVKGKLTVDPKPLTVTADAKSKVYGSADPGLTYAITSGSLESGDSLSGSLTRDPGETVAGSPYAIKRDTLSAGSNYDLTYVGASLTITAKPVTGSFTAEDKVYDGDASATILARTLTAGDKVGDDDVSLAGGTATFNNKNVGTNKPVTGSGFSLDGADKDNYHLISVSGSTASITPRPITVTADAKTKTYGNPDPALTYSVTTGSLVTGDSLAGALAREPGESVAGSPYAIKQGTLTAGGNYDLGFVGADLTVTARAITVAADAKSKTYGEADPELTYKITSGSLVGGDGFVGALTRDPGESVLGSPYAIRRGTLSAGANYDLTFVSANLTITARAITVTAADKTKVLGAVDPQLTYSITSGSLAAGDALSGNLTRDAGETIGSYAIKQGTLTAGPNYNLTFVNGTLKIVYATATCLGSPGHAILQPINSDGTSIFKQGSTVPAKFRVCDVNGNSIGTAGVVSSFKLVKTVAGTLESTVNEPVDSTTPDTAFRWSVSDQQWIFNINTKGLRANQTYAYDVTLNDGTKISFQFGLK